MWQIASDNAVTPSLAEWRSLKPRRLLDRTLFIECPQFPVMDGKTAHFIAAGRLSDAIIGQCDKIVVRGKVWHWDFKTVALNNEAKARYGERGMFQNPVETQMVEGNFYDTTRQLYQVPRNYNVRESVKFPL